MSGLFRSATSTASARETVRPLSFSGASSGGGGAGVGVGARAAEGGIHRVAGVSGASAPRWVHPARSNARPAAAKARTAGLVTIPFYHCCVVNRRIALSGLVWVVPLLAACGATRPMPTLEDYSFGTSVFVEELRRNFQAGELTGGEDSLEGKKEREDFFEGKRGGGSAALESPEASPLRELQERWRSACHLRCARCGPHHRPSEEILFGRDPARRGSPAGLGARGRPEARGGCEPSSISLSFAEESVDSSPNGALAVALRCRRRRGRRDSARHPSSLRRGRFPRPRRAARAPRSRGVDESLPPRDASPPGRSPRGRGWGRGR